MRDTPEAWSTFNTLTLALTVPALAITKPKIVQQFLDNSPAAQATQSLDQPYGPAALQKLDVYHHPLPHNNLRPVVLFVHGGAWSHGSKEIFRMVGKQFRKEGFVGVNMNYRRYPNSASVIDQAADVGKSLVWTRDNIKRFGGDPANIILVGHSSG